MQNNQIKIILLFFILVFTSTSSSFGQAFARDIEVADSLFKEKKFTESFDIYKAIHETGEHASPAMLLKMAYIREGLGDEAGALFYLNSYYLRTTNDKVFDKMEQLADKNDLNGYEYSDQDWFFNIYYQYHYHILTSLFLVGILLGALVVYNKIAKTKKSYTAGFGLLFVIVMLFIAVNFGAEYDQGILVKNNSYIMSAPSSSADVLDVSKAGHRVQVLGTEDVWLKIQWGNQIGYIKDTYVRQLHF